jgi:ribonucleoside-diphosphate reductase beta chain
MMQEVNHSKSYSVLLDAAGNSSEVFDLYKKDEALKRKNERIAEQFAKYITGNSAEEMLLSAMASVNLEGIYFLLGFGYIYTLGDKVPGARDMIKFISRDELNTHLPLFANIFKTIQKENKIAYKTIDKTYEMIQEAIDIELEYGRYLIENYPIMGLSKDMVEQTVYNYANDRLRKIGLEPIFKETDKTFLQRLVEKHLKMNDVKQNFFEANVSTYAKSSIDLDDF